MNEDFSLKFRLPEVGKKKITRVFVLFLKNRTRDGSLMDHTGAPVPQFEHRLFLKLRELHQFFTVQQVFLQLRVE